MPKLPLHRYRLYVVGVSPVGERARINARRVLTELFNQAFELEVVDILQSPEEAEQDHIIAAPALVRLSPAPFLKVVGDLSNPERIKSFICGVQHE